MLKNPGPVERPMTLEDIERLEVAEQLCFPEDPWTGEAFRDILSLPSFHGRVLEEEGHLIGYLVAYEVLDEGELINIAILPDQRGQGLGRKLLGNWLVRLQANDFRRVFLDVRRSNSTAIHLYESFGFTVIGTRKRYYASGEDALEMMLVLQGEPGTNELEEDTDE